MRRARLCMVMTTTRRGSRRTCLRHGGSVTICSAQVYNMILLHHKSSNFAQRRRQPTRMITPPRDIIVTIGRTHMHIIQWLCVRRPMRLARQYCALLLQKRMRIMSTRRRLRLRFRHTRTRPIAIIHNNHGHARIPTRRVTRFAGTRPRHPQLQIRAFQRIPQSDTTATNARAIVRAIYHEHTPITNTPTSARPQPLAAIL